MWAGRRLPQRNLLARAKVEVRERGNPTGAMLIAKSSDRVAHLLQPRADGGAKRLRFRFEVSVEGAVGDPGSFRQGVDSSAAEAAFAEDAGGRAHDFRPRLILVLYRVTHA